MEKSWNVRAVFIGLLIVVASVMLLPTMLNRQANPWLEKINDGISLGLDLKGGIHFVLNVDVDKAVQDKVERRVDEITIKLDEEKIKYSKVSADPVLPKIYVTLDSSANVEKFKKEVVRYFGDIKEIGNNGNVYTLALRKKSIDFIKTNSVDQAIETLRSRIDELGLKEPVVEKQGTTSILIQLPGYKDIDRARRIIGQTAQLEFKIEAEDKDPLSAYSNNLPQGINLLPARGQKADGSLLTYKYAKSKDKKALLAFLKDKAPKETEFLLEEIDYANGEKEYRSHLLYKKSYITGDMLTDARVSIDQQRNRPYVSMAFDRNGARIFEQVTGKFVKRKMAIVLDNKVKSAPVIQTKIAGGHAVITLNSMKSFNDTLKEAKDLALVLRAGSLPAPVTFEENRTVGPSLGRDSIAKGKLSIEIGFLAVVIFMIIYYGTAGLVANIALILNLLFVLAGMAMLGATLTFPGIAGIVLTVGMAVDANVIIFERIREEFDLGKGVLKALELGYDKAFSAIFDANITTALTAFILWNFGSGPIRGFAITLLLGILSSMFTAVFVTRVIFHYMMNVNNSLMHLF
jgi:protein-export membrane protein SecD